MTTRGVGLVILLLSLLFSSGCIATKVQNDVLIPAMATAWNSGLGLEAQRGGAPPGMINDFADALAERNRLAVIAQWPPINRTPSLMLSLNYRRHCTMLNDLSGLLRDILKEDGSELKSDMSELVIAADEATARLALLVGDPDFDMAVRAERDAIQLRFAIAASEQARAAEHRIIGVIHAALGMGAVAV